MIEWILITFLFFLSIYLLIKNLEWRFKFEDRVKSYIERMEEKIKKEAVERSSRILSAKAIEKIIPIVKDFGHDPHDVRWIGDPIDFIVFDGLSRGKVEKVTFVEVKTGESKLNEREKSVKEAVKNKSVFWEEFRIKD